MASCCRRDRPRRLKALGHNPQLLVIRPAPPAPSLHHLKPFKLSTALMAVHKDCYAPIGLIQQGGPRRRETEELVEDAFSEMLKDVVSRSNSALPTPPQATIPSPTLPPSPPPPDTFTLPPLDQVSAEIRELTGTVIEPTTTSGSGYGGGYYSYQQPTA